MTDDGLLPVHLLGLPVPLAAKSQQHFEELEREFTLLAAGAADDEHEVPRRLLDLVAALTTQYAGVADGPSERLAAAIDRGDQVIEDHELRLPPDAGPATAQLGAMLDEADEHCRQGEHLLTLATPDDCVAYRRWYLDEVVAQLAGREPRPWRALRPA